MGEIYDISSGKVITRADRTTPVQFDRTARDALVREAEIAVGHLATAVSSLGEDGLPPELGHQAAKDLMELLGRTHLAVRALVHHLDPNLSVE